MASAVSAASACKDKIRLNPLPSIGGAVAAGFVLARLPVIAILGLAIRVALALVRPALLVLGGAKAWDLIQACREDVSQAAPENHY